ncbi:sensor histidine kinase [Leptospira levettii]|uniref:histidine kinase n=1 Tax=Leptospira levettii TaxID=2023178 RepID=A0ABY2ML21_9LEPT|nr:HAMP domain-containing sensor histidine kinase [Leptospira levettii]MCW7475262.1 HAMP domain-containing histidine kinase [Leptospira levettii]TGL09961.1 sensor histidine kinase [Leptospira levettii]TGL68479.1 sensor histidine kinase [Leptospira levettii]TGM30655.1 sensor histidine kinase [Leptospira levettii]
MKLVFQKIGLRYLLNLGVNHQLDLQTSVRVQLANLIAILGILSNIQYSILFVIAGAPNVWIMNCIHLSVITIFSYILYLNFKEQYSLARILLIFTISIPLVFVSFISFGNSGGFYYYFLVFALAPFVLFSYEDKFWILLVFLTNNLFYIWFEFFGTPGKFQEGTLLYDPKIQELFRVNSVVSCLFFVALIMFYFLRNTNRIQQEMIRTNQHKDRIFSILAHDLKGPIGTMNSYLGFLNETLPDREELLVALRELKKSTNQSYLVLENLLDWVRNESKKIPTHLEYINLYTVTQNAKDILELQATDKGIQWQIQLSDPLMVYCDERMISTVLRNLFSNAIKFSHPKGTVTITSVTGPKYLDLSIVDMGIGMSKEQIRQIGEGKPFPTAFGTQGEKGTGLGLLVCTEMLRNQGCTMNVTSSTNHGTKITIRIPNSP